MEKSLIERVKGCSQGCEKEGKKEEVLTLDRPHSLPLLCSFDKCLVMSGVCTHGEGGRFLAVRTACVL